MCTITGRDFFLAAPRLVITRNKNGNGLLGLDWDMPRTRFRGTITGLRDRRRFPDDVHTILNGDAGKSRYEFYVSLFTYCF